jgi:phage-related protein
MIDAFKLVGRIALEGGKAVDEGLNKIESTLEKTSKGFKDAGKKTKDFGKKLAPISGLVAGVGAGLFALGVKAGDNADRILDLSSATGLTTDRIQELEHVTKIAGISQTTFTDISKQLTKQMTALENGTGKGADALAELGIEFSDLEKASPDERIDMITKALMNVEDPSRRAHLGTDLLKGSYEDLAPVLDMTEEEFNALKQEAHELGSVMSGDALNDANEFRIEMEKLKIQFGNVGRELAVKFIPLFQEHLLPLVQRGIDFISKLADRLGDMSPNTIKTIAVIGGLIAILSPAIIFIGMLISSVGSVIGVIGKAIKIFKLFNLTLLANPITWIVLGVLSLIAVGILLYKNWDEVVNFLSKAWQTMKNQVAQLRDNITNSITQMRERVNQRVNAMRDGMLNTFTNARNKAGEIFNNLRDRIVSPIERARDTIQGIVNRITGFFTNMNLSIPSIRMPKLPHFSIQGKLDLLNLPPQIPKLKVDWRARGGVLDNPTLIGAGEKGTELILPLQNRRYMKPFSDAVSENLKASGTEKGTIEKLEIPIVLNGREIARVLSRDIDRELEKRRKTAQRGGTT